MAGNVVQSQHAPLVTQLVEPVRIAWADNVFFGAETGLPTNAGVRIEDPRLQRDAAGVWLPTAESPGGIGMPASLSSIKTDIQGRERIGGVSPGCFQFSSSSPIRFSPLAARDVGPNWL